MGKYQYMNLEQKLAKIRKKMPVLLKKYHNEESDYDFATLDDIYESLTPALNKYGVNFDIVGEKPTQCDASGNPEYLTLDKDNFWRYESDLELCWTNIDNPKEVNRAVIHIIGTNEIPDKAHGTALTYGLKYYFRNKFCMRQLGSVQEDPDGMEYSTEEAETGTERNSASQNQKGKGTKSETSASEKKDRKEREPAAKSGKNRIPGNACPEPRKMTEPGDGEKSAKPDHLRNEGKEPEKGGLSGEKSVPEAKKSEIPVKNEKPEEPQEKTEKAGSQRTEAAKQPEETGDGFHTVDEGEVPFDESGFLDELEQEMEEQTEDADSGLEAAKNFVCTFGLYNGTTLGEMMVSGIKGLEAVKWIANRYKGPDKSMVEAAKLLLENQDLVIMQQAA